jgi:hypothetical protein
MWTFAVLTAAVAALWTISGWWDVGWTHTGARRTWSIIAARGMLAFVVSPRTAADGEQRVDGLGEGFWTTRLTIDAAPNWYWTPIADTGNRPPQWRLALPLWWFVAAGSLLAATLRYRSYQRRRPPGHCQACGYSLAGVAAGNCPECGAGPAT